jgi:hypothetical protein
VDSRPSHPETPILLTALTASVVKEPELIQIQDADAEARRLGCNQWQIVPSEPRSRDEYTGIASVSDDRISWLHDTATGAGPLLVVGLNARGRPRSMTDKEINFWTRRLESWRTSAIETAAVKEQPRTDAPSLAPPTREDLARQLAELYATRSALNQKIALVEEQLRAMPRLAESTP